MSHQKGGANQEVRPPLLHALAPPTVFHSPVARTTRLATSALLPPLAHAREDSAAQRDGCLGDRITFRKSTQAPSKKEHTSGQLPITLEAIEEHGIKYQDHK